jgi:hypothetical protein
LLFFFGSEIRNPESYIQNPGSNIWYSGWIKNLNPG